jgi:hypothetical protein
MSTVQIDKSVIERAIDAFDLFNETAYGHFLVYSDDIGAFNEVEHDLRAALAAQEPAQSVEPEPYAYEQGRSNGDGTYSVVIEKYLRDPVKDWPVKPLYTHPAPAKPCILSQEHSDNAAVDKFASEMKDKLSQARDKGRSGWESCSEETLSKMLREHVEKGDPRDVANFCMFIHTLGYRIAPAAPAKPLSDGLRVKLANPSNWLGFGCDVDAVFTVFDKKHYAGFGSGTGVRVRPAVQPEHPQSELLWYDSAHFTPLPVKPLSDEQILAAIEPFISSGKRTDLLLGKLNYLEYRAIEAAHGIKET